MKDLKIPFNLYDIFGYLIPGLSLLVLCFFSYDLPLLYELFIQDITSKQIGVNNSLFSIFLNLFTQNNVLVIAFIVLFVCYIVGHFVSALSSFFLERLLVENALGYPASNLFKLEKSQNKKKNEEPGKFFSFIWYKGFYPWMAILLNNTFKNYKRPYSDDFIKKFLARFKSTFQIDGKNGSDVFWLSFEFVIHNYSIATQRSIHFLNLYGFCRNLSMTFLLSGMFLFIFGWIHVSLISGLLFFMVYSFIGFSFFWNYLKLLRRLNDEIFRAFYLNGSNLDLKTIETTEKT